MAAYGDVQEFEVRVTTDSAKSQLIGQLVQAAVMLSPDGIRAAIDAVRSMRQNPMFAHGGKGGGKGALTTFSPMHGDLHGYCAQYGLGPDVHAALSALPPHQLEAVMSAPLDMARNPSAVVMARVTKAQQGILPGGEARVGDWTCTSCGASNFARRDECFKCGKHRSQSTVLQAEVEQYCQQWSVGQDVAYALSALPPHFQKAIMEAPLDQARNPSAVISTRIEKAKQGKLPSTGASAPREGDWTCTGCGTSNFAKRTTCFKCGSPPGATLEQSTAAAPIADPSAQPLAKRPRPGAGDVPALASAGAGPSEQDIAGFVQLYSLDAMVQQELSQLPADACAAVLSAPLDQARNPAAVVRARIQKAQRGELHGMQAREGDWTCTHCGMSNFARRGDCFKCHAPRA